MTRIALRFLPLLITTSALAQAVTPEAPTEKASPVAIAVFLLLFVGACGGYFFYLWWNNRKHPEGKKD
jgi:hypothetical protein